LTTQRSKTYSREPRPLRARFIHKKLLWNTHTCVFQMLASTM